MTSPLAVRAQTAAALPERGGNVGGKVELRFSADGGLTLRTLCAMCWA